MSAVPPPRAQTPSLPPPPLAIFYGPLEPGNPVIENFERDLHDCLSFLRRKREAAGGAGARQQELHRRGATNLFNIWNNYKTRFPDWYYNEKLVKIGDQLTEMKEYKLALVQCYGRYLQQISTVNIDQLELDVCQFQSHFFPNGFRDKTASCTFHVLQARNNCLYKMVCDADVDLLNQESLNTCFRILSTLQLIMQMILPHENLCWLVYNGTIHMYTICRHLMTVGQSAKVHEYLLWACVCMESSVPLLAIHYLTWRTTLYAAVCQCYYDCQAGMYGEIFARRGLIKIDELKQMENISSSPLSLETKKKFKEATVKMAAMIFKRSAFEPRRRPKGIFRPRPKANLREIQNTPWPRTVSERLLMEIFDCNSSQFFAILEALFDKNRRTLIPAPPVPDEVEIRDVVSELFFAGMDILDGGGSNVQGNMPTESSVIITASTTLMQHILAGRNLISGEAALRFLKMAFSYEEWDTFDHVTGLFFTFLQSQKNPVWKKAEAELKILLVMQPLVSSRKPRHSLYVQGNNIREAPSARFPGKKSIAFQGSAKTRKMTDELFLLAITLYSCVCTSDEVLPDREMVIDATMFLWQRCKVGIQRIQMSGTNFLKHSLKYQTFKWINILYIVNEVIHTINLGDTNAVVMAEVVLRLTAVMENIVEFTVKSRNIPERIDTAATSEFFIDDMPSLIQKCPLEQLHLAYQYLDRAISAINRAHRITLLPDGTSVLDNCCKKHLNTNEKFIIGNNFIMDLNLELIQTQHRVAVKLLKLSQGTQTDEKNTKSKSSVKDASQPKYLTEPDIMKKIKKNKLSKALYFMHKATLMFCVGLSNTSANQLLEEAFTLIQKAEAEQNALCATLQQPASSVKSKVPPPPILLSRSHCSMAFKPAPFAPPVKVSWYSIFGCVAEGSNPKVRLNHYNLENTAEMTPADENCVLEVKGLETNQSYIFAVAAYASDGKLIGNSIGEMTKPILAYPPLSAVTVRAYLIQSAFQTENYTLCKKAFQPLWDYFVSVPHTPVADVTVVSTSTHVTLHKSRLIPDAVSQASPNLLYLFIRSIFIINDITVTDGALFCDSVCFNELKYSRQVARLNECGRMLVAVELSNWLNDVHYSLQSVVNCYGLIAPLIYHKIASEPVIQIIIKCLSVIQEIPCSTLQRKSAACYDSIQHMIACSCFFSVKVLRTWKEYELAIVIINYGKKLLDSSQVAVGERGDEMLDDEISTKRHKSLAAAEKVNENLEALENNLLRLTKPGQELTGEEDALLLFPVVTNWQTRNAFREVLKFKKSPRFLEYFVKLLAKALSEEKFSRILDWTDEIQDYLKKRNRFLIGIKRIVKKKPKADQKKHGAEFHNVKGSVVGKKKWKTFKKDQHKFLPKHPCLGKSFDLQRKEREELRKIACLILIQKLNTTTSVFIKRRRFRQLMVEEMPWKSQLNIYLAITYFNLFKKRIEELYNIDDNSLQSWQSYNEMDPEIFSLNNSGTIIVRPTVEEEMKTKPTVFTRTPSGRIKRKKDALDPSSPAFDSGSSLPASDPTLQSASSDTDSSSSLLDHSNCLTPETDTMVDPTDPAQLSSSVSASVADEISEHSSKLNERDMARPHGTSEKGGSTTVKERERALCYSAILEHFPKIFLHFKRAVVFAHRGGHWTLLQNACRDLWNYTQEIQMIMKHSESFCVSFAITRELFLNTIWQPYCLASDMLLDMIVDLQASNSVKIIEAEGDFCVPSCVGDIAHEEGGSNLSFEYPFDDINVVDLQGVRNLILRTVEILFHLKKWESLVYIAMQFNTITHERYAEQVTPLLVFAQRQLQERIQLSDASSFQPLFKELVTATGDKVCCRDFVAKKLHAAAKCNERTNELHFYNSDARSQVYVPLDTTDTLKCFRESLEKSKHHSRALKYSRKLLSLFLAHTQEHSGKLNRTVTFQFGSRPKVGFSMGTELTYQPEPPDLSEENFTSLSMVESSSISQSKLSVIISSYERTLEALQTYNQQGLKVQAFHELGNLHFYTENKRDAFKCWCQGLDAALNIADALHHWQELDDLSENAIGNLANRSQDYCDKFISRAGIWGCLQGAVLAAKISQYILLYDVKLRTKTCILSAVLFKSLFRASLPHPTADCDFVQYETDTLIPGIDIFLDRYRADVGTVVASLSFLIYELHCCKQNLIILPLFTLYQYFVSEVCRDAIKSIEGRILKIKVLSELGFFSDAFQELCTINRGEKIPWKLTSVYRIIQKLPVSAKFDSSQPLLTNVNLQALEDVFNRSLHPIWISVCEPRIVNNLMLAKMHFIISLAATLNCVPEKVMKTTYCLNSDILRKSGKNAEAYLKGFLPGTSNASGKRDPSVMIVELEKLKDSLNMPTLKGILLAEAEERINSILENLQNKYGTLINECTAAELETVIEAKLQLVVIAQQRLQTAFSAALAFSAVKLLQDADVFKKKCNLSPDAEQIDKASEEGSYIEDSHLLHNTIAREHLNIHLWLRCRLALVKAITAQARGIETMQENELSECSYVIREVQMEAEAFNDVETLAEITMQAVKLGLQGRQPVADIKFLLQNTIRFLEEKTLISPPACLTLVQSMLLLADILRTEAEDDSEHHTSKTDQWNLLILAHKLVIKQLFILGQSLEQHAGDPTVTTLTESLQNIYLPQIKLLAKVKMRLGHALALELSCTSKTQNEVKWQLALQHTETALDLCTASVKRELDLEAEILFRKGKIERQLDMICGNKSMSAVESLLNGIKLSLRSYQNYGLIRRAYLEMALQYFYLITHKDESLSSGTLKGQAFKPRSARRRVSSEEITVLEMYRVQAWIAVRAAAQVGDAVLAFHQLTGRKAVKLYHMKHGILPHIPEFALLDLTSSYKDFLSDGYNVIYKVPMMSPEHDDRSESGRAESASSEESQDKQKIPWSHVIRYNTYLTTLLNMSPLLAVPKAGAGLFAREDMLFTSVFDTSTTLRLAALHSFLKAYLPIYSDCCLHQPPKELYGFEKPCYSMTVLGKSTPETLGAAKRLSSERISPGVAWSSDTDIRSENSATSIPFKELCVQWYLPSLEQSAKGGDNMVLFIYAYNTKAVKITNIKSFQSARIYCGYLWIPLERVLAVRATLSELQHQTEMLMQSVLPALIQSDIQRNLPIASSSSNPEKVPIDEKTKEMARQCFSEIKALLSVGAMHSSPLTEIPFDITLPSIKNLRRLFDPANGCVITSGSVFNWIVSLLT
ncbi:cilia- and flagella-associated protein 54 isoform X2 [Hemicordylus capensis]|uniref:cilia- and flagella-associated protein 54 isoform X2 n=1 Tax=Hemicordylus capensis TaxID=884348 RepID=UPI002303BE17|nr:cilia- and flagella-associated protein 54 isoform X2 [Hemicordylus capensis]